MKYGVKKVSKVTVADIWRWLVFFISLSVKNGRKANKRTCQYAPRAANGGRGALPCERGRFGAMFTDATPVITYVLWRIMVPVSCLLTPLL